MPRNRRPKLLHGALTALLVSTLSGCSLGMLLSQPWIRSADFNDVAVIGDSIFALSGGIQDRLHAQAGGTFRNYTTSGAELTGGLIEPSVAAQYDIAQGDAPVRVLVADGGGNDILIPVIAFDPHDCLTQWWEFGRLSRSCQDLIDDIAVDGANLMNQAHADGVTDIVYLGYYYTKNGLLGPLSDLKEAVDYGDMRIAQACASSVGNCSFVDPRSTIRRWDITADGVHPDGSGSRKLADLLWPVLAPKL